jgi:hypothetical protein
MTDDEPTKAELQEQIESLQRRVNELETLVDENHSAGEKDDTDRYDAAVIDYIERNGDPGPRRTVELYTELTGISKRKTAKRRAKQLRNSQRFEEIT